jgi:hypothetical protein
MRRVAILGLLAILLTACTTGDVVPVTTDPAWTTPAPAPLGSSQFDTGDATRRPVIHEILISETDLQNGWHIVPGESFQVAVLTEKADKVTFRGFVPGEEQFDPDENGIVERGVPEKTEDGRIRWSASGGNLAGRTMVMYAVAENQYGRTVSPFLFVAWDYNQGHRK